jgi:single-strand DNA-binding protein
MGANALWKFYILIGFTDCFNEQLIHFIALVNRSSSNLNSVAVNCLFNKNVAVMIKLQIIGNLGKDCVVNNVNGKNVINFSVAHTERYKDAQGNQKDRTTWVECAYWTDRTAIAPYLKKGQTVYVEGNPDVRTYTTQDGRNGASLQLRVASVQLISGNRPDANHTSSPQINQQQSQSADPTFSISANDITDSTGDDLPF